RLATFQHWGRASVTSRSCYRASRLLVPEERGPDLGVCANQPPLNLAIRERAPETRSPFAMGSVFQTSGALTDAKPADIDALIAALQKRLAAQVPYYIKLPAIPE